MAHDLGGTMAQLAIAWAASHPHVSSVITGASRTSQVTENMKAVELLDKLTPSVRAEIDEVLGNRPEPDTDFREG
jgi:aryl-alcohol dehydrogenase-like predicted oxidoreductase